MFRPRTLASSLLLSSALALAAIPAEAFPGAFVSKNAEPPVATSTHIIVMRKGDASAVTVMPDYVGPIEPFLIVMPVPGDVTIERVRSVKREYVDRVDKLSAPKFHEFWEMDPCEPGPAQQEWERDLSVTGAGMLGGGAQEGTRKVDKELFMKVDASVKEGEYKFTLLSPEEAQGIADWLAKKGMKPKPELVSALIAYAKAGMKLLVAEVDPNKIELIGGDRAILSPIRWWSEKPVTSLPVTLGLSSMGAFQELFVFVFDSEHRYEAKNYPNGFPPTNVEIDFHAKERMGEFYAALHDLWLKKHPGAFLTEFAWPTQGCGQPCQDEPLLIGELISLGGDVFEEFVPKEEREPKVPPLTAEEKKAFDATLTDMKPAERIEAKKTYEKERLRVAAIKGMVARNKYILTRLHYHYDRSGLPKDLEIGVAEGGVEGGFALPKGPKGETESGDKPSEKYRFQTRYNNYHPWKGMQQCDAPERWRWGKSPRDYRGLRKIWVAEDISRKSRTQISPAVVMHTAIPDLGLAAMPPSEDDATYVAKNAPVDGGVDAGAGGAAKKSGCGCSTPGSRGSLGSAALAAAALLGANARRRRRAGQG